MFSLAIGCVDRFIRKVPTWKPNQFQLLGTICLLIASKMKDNNSFSLDRLAAFTDFSVTRSEILVHIFWDINSCEKYFLRTYLIDYTEPNEPTAGCSRTVFSCVEGLVSNSKIWMHQRKTKFRKAKSRKTKSWKTKLKPNFFVDILYSY